eukprot:TRINITY_DN22205_c0_g1_i1.p1 TRINITY_DN22205_c0_g1~~TRINITY_DN22205_c0_g1_i1.p1  ORF type:complete len:360 (+),score=96.48 TRINITY_DN22205_c0_g1_i1:10-1089(+)
MKIIHLKKIVGAAMKRCYDIKREMNGGTTLTPDSFYNLLEEMGVLEDLKSRNNQPEGSKSTEGHMALDEISDNSYEHFSSMIEEIARFIEEHERKLEIQTLHQFPLTPSDPPQALKEFATKEQENNSPPKRKSLKKSKARKSNGKYCARNCMCADTGLVKVREHRRDCAVYNHFRTYPYCVCSKRQDEDNHKKKACGSRNSFLLELSKTVDKIHSNYAVFFRTHQYILKEQHMDVALFDYGRMIGDCLLCGRPVENGFKHFYECERKKGVVRDFMLCFVNQKMKKEVGLEPFSSDWFENVDEEAVEMYKMQEAEGVVTEEVEMGSQEVGEGDEESGPLEGFEGGDLDLNCDLDATALYA